MGALHQPGVAKLLDSVTPDRGRQVAGADACSAGGRISDITRTRSSHVAQQTGVVVSSTGSDLGMPSHITILSSDPASPTALPIAPST